MTVQPAHGLESLGQEQGGWLPVPDGDEEAEEKTTEAAGLSVGEESLRTERWPSAGTLGAPGGRNLGARQAGTGPCRHPRPGHSGLE